MLKYSLCNSYFSRLRRVFVVPDMGFIFPKSIPLISVGTVLSCFLVKFVPKFQLTFIYFRQRETHYGWFLFLKSQEQLGFSLQYHLLRIFAQISKMRLWVLQPQLKGKNYNGQKKDFCNAGLPQLQT